MKQSYLQKDTLYYMNIKEIDVELPNLKVSAESKFLIIGKWMAKWVKEYLVCGKISENYVLPSKSEFAYLLGVSLGTVQNAIRYVEDLGIVESKQCIGTLVKTGENKIQKLTSKRDVSVEKIKSYINSKGFKIGDLLPSSRTIAKEISCPINTTRAALEFLATNSIIQKNFEKRSWSLIKDDFSVDENKQSETMVKIVSKNLEKFITKNLKPGAKIPSHALLANELKTSMRTVHDALEVLKNKGIILPRRGKYGTYVIKMPQSDVEKSENKFENSIFAPAQDTAFYHYEKIQNYIKRMIAQEYDVGDKLPSISEVAKMLDVNNNTVRKAFHNLSKEGYLVFSRGRYGGTFVIDIPEVEQQTFKWLAVNPQYAQNFVQN